MHDMIVVMMCRCVQETLKFLKVAEMLNLRLGHALADERGGQGLPPPPGSKWVSCWFCSQAPKLLATVG
jgi:hypothetical protein